MLRQAGLELKGKIAGLLYFLIHALRLGHGRAVAPHTHTPNTNT